MIIRGRVSIARTLVQWNLFKKLVVGAKKMINHVVFGLGIIKTQRPITEIAINPFWFSRNDGKRLEFVISRGVLAFRSHGRRAIVVAIFDRYTGKLGSSTMVVDRGGRGSPALLTARRHFSPPTKTLGSQESECDFDNVMDKLQNYESPLDLVLYYGSISSLLTIAMNKNENGMVNWIPLLASIDFLCHPIHMVGQSIRCAFGSWELGSPSTQPILVNITTTNSSSPKSPPPRQIVV